VRRNPITPALAVVIGLILLAELYVVTYSESLFEFLFVAQAKFTPGLLLAPLSHATFYTHYLPNMLMFLWLGWPLEDRLSKQQFVAFIAATAYLPTYLQVAYAVVTTGTAGTLGFSGAVYAVPPLLSFIILQDDHSGRVGLGDIGNSAVAITVVIPLLMLGLLDFFSVLPSADITHAVGYAAGLGYGVAKYIGL